jgi:hypothetical protein
MTDEQLTFVGLVRNDHPATAQEAAARAPAGRAGRAVRSFIQSRGQRGATDEELIEAVMAYGYAMNTIRPRRVELVRAGVVADSGRTRATGSGRDAIVWVAV